ncbi:MAG TPA: hypothetical protein VLU46_09070 [Thermoanaerobaculia bacterium]|nr:hypothetical protein [Thermoanaerobaculia bacterium]
MRKPTPAEDTRIAHEIVSVLPEGSTARVLSDDGEAVRFIVNADGLKLRSVVLDRESLRRLHCDPARDVKIEYLQRDLATSAGRRAEFRYPRHSRIVRRTPKAARLRAVSLAVAALAR